MEKLLAPIMVFAFVLSLIGVFVLVIRGARKSSRRAVVLGWALQFLGVGMNPLPPPQEQIDEANRQNRVKKAAEAGGSGGLVLKAQVRYAAKRDYSAFGFTFQLGASRLTSSGPAWTKPTRV